MHTAPDGTYAFCVPAGWEVQVENEYGSEWFLFAPLQGDDDAFRENLNLQRVGGRGAPGLDELAERQVEALRGALDGFEHVATQEARLGNQPARTVQYRASLDDVRVEGRQTVAVANDRLYVLTYSAAPGEDPFLPAAQETLASFRFLA
jgi:hypothetical protein